MNIEEINFPLQLPAGRAKRWARVLLGRLLCAVAPNRERALLAGEVEHPFVLADRLRVAALVDRHLRQGTLDQLAPIQARFWAGGQATDFHAHAESRFQSWWVERHSKVVGWMQDERQRRPGAYRRLVEIGCGSGLVLADIAQRVPELDTLVGLDLSAPQIEMNRQRFKDPRLQFEAGDASDWIARHLEPGSIVFTNAGVLEYFSMPKLRALFRDVAAKAPAMIVMIEPMALGFDADSDAEPTPYGAENSLSRPYARLLREAGFVLRRHEYEDESHHRRFLCLASVPDLA